MPFYVYKRPDGSTFEVKQGITDKALTKDPVSNVPVERVMFPPTINFIGPGFHNTDYGTKKTRHKSAKK
jgi:predicted nucleic acid-binding Zn ribbon protein